MHKNIPALILFGLTGLLGAPVSQATLISYELDSIGGNTWEYTYTVDNNSLGADLEWFSVYFDLGLFENLLVGPAPAGWDPLVLQPDPGLPDDGLYDAFALAGGIAPGGTLGGFSVRFDFLGSGTPGSQFFEVFDVMTVGVLDSGFTMAAVPVPVPVPEPGTIGLLCCGLLLVALRGRLRGSRGRRAA